MIGYGTQTRVVALNHYTFHSGALQLKCACHSSCHCVCVCASVCFFFLRVWACDHICVCGMYGLLRSSNTLAQMGRDSNFMS